MSYDGAEAFLIFVLSEEGDIEDLSETLVAEVSRNRTPRPCTIFDIRLATVKPIRLGSRLWTK
jgi:hypothetical protein